MHKIRIKTSMSNSVQQMTLIVSLALVTISGCCTSNAPIGGEIALGIEAVSPTPGSADSSVAVDGEDRLVVALGEATTGPVNRVIVRRREDSGWNELGSPHGTDARAFTPALAIAEGDAPAVAWSQLAQSERVHVAIRRNEQWQSLEGADSGRADRRSLLPKLAAGPAGVLALAFWSVDGDRASLEIRMRSGDAWQVVPSPAPNVPFGLQTGLNSSSTIAFSADGGLVAVWCDGTEQRPLVHVARWQDGRWSPLGEPLDGRAPNIAVSGVDSGRPHGARIRASDAGPRVVVTAWTGERWEELGGEGPWRDTSQCWSTALDFDSNNAPVLAWETGNEDFRRVHVRRWSGSAWEPVAGLGSSRNGDSVAPLNRLATRPQLTAVQSICVFFVVYNDRVYRRCAR